MTSKKGSLELSINAIVIVVLAFVLLGLGLGFIRNQFKSIGETTGQVQEQVKQQILEDLRTGDKKLSFPSQRVQLDKAGARDLAIGIKNTQPAGELSFYIEVFTAQDKGNEIKCDEDAAAGDFESISITCDDGSERIESLNFFWDSGPYSLGVADAEVYPISIEDVSKTSNSYLVKIRIYSADAEGVINPTPYAEKSFFVQVT